MGTSIRRAFGWGRAYEHVAWKGSLAQEHRGNGRGAGLLLRRLRWSGLRDVLWRSEAALHRALHAPQAAPNQPLTAAKQEMEEERGQVRLLCTSSPVMSSF